MSSKVIETTIKLSKLRKIVIDNNAQFLCHALAHSIRKKWDNYVADEDVLFQEIKRVIGPHYIHNVKRAFLSDWLKNVPGHLRISMKYHNSDDGAIRTKFRVKFLTWVINKFGDQEIRVSCIRRT